MAFTIAVMNQRNGVGKTTSVGNLGCMLALGDSRVLLVDLDPQAGLTDALGMSKPDSETFRRLYCESDALSRGILTTGHENLFALPASSGLGLLEIDFKSSPRRNVIVRDALESVSRDFDFILLDCPSILEFFIVNAACAADALIIPVPCLPNSDEDLGTFLVYLDNIIYSNNLTYAYIGVFYNLYTPTSPLCRRIVDKSGELHSGFVFKTRIPRCRAIAESVYSNKMAAGYDITALGTMAYGKLAREVAEHAGAKTI